MARLLDIPQLARDPVLPDDRALGDTVIGSWAWDAGRRRIELSPEAGRMLGVTAGLGAPTLEYVLDRVLAGDRSTVLAAAERATRGMPVELLEFRVLMGDYSLRHLQADISPADGNGLAGTICDVTAQRELGQQLSLMTGLTEVLSGPEEPAGAALLERLGTALGAGSAAVWIPGGDGALELRESWPEAGAGERLARTRLRAGEDAPGLAWSWSAPVSTLEPAGARDRVGRGDRSRRSDRTRDGELRSRRDAAGAYHGYLAFPAVHRGEVVAVISVETPHRIRLTACFEATLASIGVEIGRALGRYVRRARCPLSLRELEILQLAAEGRSGPAIAAALHVSGSTVKTHFEHIYRKCAVQDRAGAVAKALREGLIH